MVTGTFTCVEMHLFFPDLLPVSELRLPRPMPPLCPHRGSHPGVFLTSLRWTPYPLNVCMKVAVSFTVHSLYVFFAKIYNSFPREKPKLTFFAWIRRKWQDRESTQQSKSGCLSFWNTNAFSYGYLLSKTMC